MNVITESYGFKSLWDDVFIDSYEGFYPNMSNYHKHEYFEISFILSGNVNVLLADSVEHSTSSKIVLLRPLTPHYIYCEPDVLYRRTNICFSKDLAISFPPEIHRLMSIFGENGTVITVETETIKKYIKITEEIEKEENLLRKKLLIMYLVSLISDSINTNGKTTKIPHFVTEALSYIGTHYAEKIVALELAEKLNIGRTTLMKSFKKYTGTTINEYLIGCRMKKALIMLEDGKQLWDIAENCGFTDAPNFIRSFKKQFGTTPNAWRKTMN